MTTTTEPDPVKTLEAKLAELRVPFPPEMIGKLPRVTCKDCSDRSKNCTKHSKTRCATCHAYISTAHIHLDFVGHAELTDRLLTVDPLWNWEPLAFDERGLPAITEAFTDDRMPGFRMWIRLTICGVERLGVGSVEKGIAAFDIEKQLIGDALRNAAMRFGVALDLWAKSDLASQHADNAADDSTSEQKTTRRAAPRRATGATLPDSELTVVPTGPSMRDGEPEEEWHKSHEKQRAAGVAPPDRADHGDIALMPARALVEALRAAGLEDSGSVPQMRLRLQEHRSGVSPAKTEASGERMATEKQRSYVNSFWSGLSDEDRYDGISEVIGRQIESSKELTFAEAKQVIEVMKPEEK